MIYTVTFNPSIDYIVNVDNFMTGVVTVSYTHLTLPTNREV